MPLGGIGTGTVSLGGRGNLLDWEIGNTPAKGVAPRHGFFALWARPVGGQSSTRVLEGPIDELDYVGWEGSEAPNAGLPRFASARFGAAYPLATVGLADPGVPLEVTLEAFNPMVPGDVAASSLPVAVLRYRLTNPGPVTVEAAVSGNFSFGEARRRDGGLLIDVPSERDPGTLAMAVLDQDDLTARTAWSSPEWRQDVLDFWDDFSADGRLTERSWDNHVASLAASLTVPPGESRTVTFVLAWHFPRRRAWSGDEIVGNHYTTLYGDAWEALERAAPLLDGLEERTVAFVRAFCDSDLPAPVKEAALFNLSTLRSQTLFRTPDGRFFGWEGTADDHGSCHGSCTHVWNYETATPYLFGEIARSMREVEFAHATDARGLMSFRVGLPLDTQARAWGIAAADGQFGALVRLYLTWRLSGDDALLAELWPHARRAMEFAWIEGGWDADRDGVPEGCQHNTMDVEYYGPNPQMAVWYLAALKAVAAMAAHLGETPFAEECLDLARRGAGWVDAHLFNGSYYRHEIRPVGEVADGLRTLVSDEPRYQLGDGCLIDQLVGQYMAHVAGLGHLLDPSRVRTALAHIAVANRRDPSIANPMRSYALNDEPALMICSYAGGVRPREPFPYFAEVMTGFEHTAAAGMIQEGLVSEGLQVIADVRSRYDGRRRNPFDEAECGHHYARAMASWSAVLALTGFGYSALEGTITFAAAPAAGDTTWFWSTGDAWGTVRQASGEVTLRVLSGSVRLSRLVLTGVGTAELSGGGLEYRVRVG